jgi:hypothetical protein
MKNFTLTLLFSFFFALANAQSQVFLTGDSLLRDIDLLEKAITEIHPGIYRYNDTTSIAQLFNNLRSKAQSGMTESEFMIALAQTTAKFKCGHTYVNPWNMKASIRNRLFGKEIYLPFGTRVIDYRIFITYNLSEYDNIEVGAEILGINGVSTGDILDSLNTVAKYDGNNQASVGRYLSITEFGTKDWEAFDLYFSLFFPFEDGKVKLKYQNFESARTQEVMIKALSKRARQDRFISKFGDQQLDTDRWSLEFVSPNYAHLKIGTFAIWNWEGFDHKLWFKEAFEKIDSSGYTNLVVDIRDNGGGLGEPRDELMSYLLKDTLKCTNGPRVLIRTTRVDPSLKPYSDTWVKQIFEGLPASTYEPLNDGFYLLKESKECENLIPKKRSFKGNVFILGGPSNVSATFLLLDQAKKNGFGTFVGQTTGGNLQGINGGEYIFFYMPYSGMEVDIPLKYFAYENMPDSGVKPDYPISLTQRNLATNDDPWLRKVDELLNQDQ